MGIYLYVVEPRHVHLENLAVKKEHRGESLFLGARRDALLDRKVREKRGDLFGAKVARVTHALMHNEATNPGGIGFLGPRAVATPTHFGHQLGQQWRWTHAQLWSQNPLR